jgi:site-specific recombinase XerD
VNLALAAVDHFLRFVGLGAAEVSRERLPQAAPRALEGHELLAFVRAAERAGARDRAIGPLFVSRSGGRLSARSVDEVLRKLGRAASVELSAHVLRHTRVTRLVRAGNDVVLVADLAGHRKLETTRRYSLPSLGDRQRAVDGLAVDQ